jgi:hypothetical protein
MKWKEMGRMIMLSLTSLTWMGLAAGIKQLLGASSCCTPPRTNCQIVWSFEKSNVRIVEKLRGHFDVPLGIPPIGIKTDELRVGMKRAAAQISGSQFEIYSFSTRHDISEAATDELLQLVGNVSKVMESKSI